MRVIEGILALVVFLLALPVVAAMLAVLGFSAYIIVVIIWAVVTMVLGI